MNKKDFNILKRCNALLSKKEVELLLRLPKLVPKEGAIVEIGSYKGGSTYLLAKSSRAYNKGKVYAIDPHRYEKGFNKNALKSFQKNIKFAKVEDQIIPIIKTSKEANKSWKGPISLLWIDGNHGYPYVKEDFLLWERYLIKGGIIAFHDSHNAPNNLLFNKKRLNDADPQRVVKENIINSNRFIDAKVADSITWAVKIKNASLKERIKNNFLANFMTIYKKGEILKKPVMKYFPGIYKKFIKR